MAKDGKTSQGVMILIGRSRDAGILQTGCYIEGGS